MNMFDLTGKTAIVTGGNKGLGKGMTEGLCEAGAKVAILASSESVYETAKECEFGLIKKNGLCNSYGANAYDCTAKGDEILMQKKEEAIKQIVLLTSEALGVFTKAATA